MQMSENLKADERSSAAFKLDSLKALLTKNPETGLPTQSIEELIPLLPTELKTNFTFVYESRSPFKESISPLYPRVILFTKDGRMVLTYTGDSSKPGYGILETMSFEDISAKFQFDAFVMPEAQKRGVALSGMAQDCNHCHGVDPRPIYDSYPLWPGFYGSIRDTFPNNAIGKKELQDYVQFLATSSKTGVYKGLVFSDKNKVSPYLDPIMFNSQKFEGALDDFKYLPNTRLGMALSDLNRRRIFRKLLTSKNFLKKEKTILKELLNCDQKQKHHLNSQILESIKAENLLRLKRAHIDSSDPVENNNHMQELKFFKEISQIDWMARVSNVDRSDWSMAMEPNSLSFFDGILSGIQDKESFYLKEDYIQEILKHMSQKDSSFRKYAKTHSVYASLGYPFGERIDLKLAKETCKLFK